MSPTYTYNEVCYTDNYSDIIDLAEDVFIFYLKRTIKQCYKVVFSMHLLGKQCQTLSILSFYACITNLPHAKQSLQETRPFSRISGKQGSPIFFKRLVRNMLLLLLLFLQSILLSSNVSLTLAPSQNNDSWRNCCRWRRWCR